MKWLLRLFEEPRDVGLVGFIIVMIVLVISQKCSSDLNSSSSSSETTSEITSQKDNHFEARALFERATEIGAFRVMSTFNLLTKTKIKTKNKNIENYTMPPLVAKPAEAYAERITKFYRNFEQNIACNLQNPINN